MAARRVMEQQLGQNSRGLKAPGLRLLGSTQQLLALACAEVHERMVRSVSH
jgi:hypothetical protein